MEQANESTQIGRWNASNRKQGRCEWGRHIWNCLYSNKLNWVQTRNQLLESSNQTGMWAVVCLRSATKTKFNGLEHTVVWEQTRKTFVWFSAWQILTYVRLFACNDPPYRRWQCFRWIFARGCASGDEQWSHFTFWFLYVIYEFNQNTAFSTNSYKLHGHTRFSYSIYSFPTNSLSDALNCCFLSICVQMWHWVSAAF